MDEQIEQITKLLFPILPYLLNGGKTVMQGLLEEIGSEIYHAGGKIWKLIQKKKYDEKRTIKKISDIYKEDLSDENIQEALQRQIIKTLKENPELINEILNLLPERKRVEKIKISDSLRTYINIDKKSKDGNSINVGNSVDSVIIIKQR